MMSLELRERIKTFEMRTHQHEWTPVREECYDSDYTYVCECGAVKLSFIDISTGRVFTNYFVVTSNVESN